MATAPAPEGDAPGRMDTAPITASAAAWMAREAAMWTGLIFTLPVNARLRGVIPRFPGALSWAIMACLQARARLLTGGCLLVEVGVGQGKKLTDFLQKIYASANIDLLFDLNGLERVVCLTLPLHLHLKEF